MISTSPWVQRVASYGEIKAFATIKHCMYHVDMELSERIIKKFEDEGFASVYEWQDKVGTVYEEHLHQGKVSLFVTDGSITFDFEGVKKEVKANERLDIAPQKLHSAIVGLQGWIVIVGEEIEGDS